MFICSNSKCFFLKGKPHLYVWETFSTQLLQVNLSSTQKLYHIKSTKKHKRGKNINWKIKWPELIINYDFILLATYVDKYNTNSSWYKRLDLGYIFVFNSTFENVYKHGNNWNWISLSLMKCDTLSKWKMKINTRKYTFQLFEGK